MSANQFEVLKFYSNFLTDEELNKGIRHFWSYNWGVQVSNGSTEDKDAPKNIFLHMDLSKINFFSKSIFKKIQLATKEKFELLRVYANGQYFGMPSDPHYDEMGSENCYTFLIYMNEEWKITWGGPTIFFNRFLDVKQQKEIVADGIFVQYPVPKLGILFPSNMLHFAESPSKFCHKFRTTVAYKLRKIN